MADPWSDPGRNPIAWSKRDCRNRNHIARRGCHDLPITPKRRKRKDCFSQRESIPDALAGRKPKREPGCARLPRRLLIEFAVAVQPAARRETRGIGPVTRVTLHVVLRRQQSRPLGMLYPSREMSSRRRREMIHAGGFSLIDSATTARVRCSWPTSSIPKLRS